MLLLQLIGHKAKSINQIYFLAWQKFEQELWANQAWAVLKDLLNMYFTTVLLSEIFPQVGIHHWTSRNHMMRIISQKFLLIYSLENCTLSMLHFWKHFWDHSWLEHHKYTCYFSDMMLWIKELQPGIDQDITKGCRDFVHSMAENLTSSLCTGISS